MSDLVFSHMALNCNNMATIERFYTRYFGFTRARLIDLGEMQIVFLKNGGAYLELFASEGDNPASAPEADGHHFQGWRHIAFQVPNVDAKLAEIGDDATIMLGPLDFDGFIPGWRTVWIKDPEGNIIEISQGYTDQDNPPLLD